MTTLTIKERTCPKFLTPRIPSATKTHGGKHYLARPILQHFPAYLPSYVEPYLGGASVFLAMDPSAYSQAYLNDVNPKLINMYLMIKEWPGDLRKRLQDIPYREDMFNAWRDRDTTPNNDPMERAVKFIVTNRMSRGGLGKSFAWSDRLRGGQPGDVNAWENAIAGLPKLSLALQGVVLEKRPAVEIILRHMSDTTCLIYADPPYLPETRTAKKAYEYEMTYAEHVELLALIGQAKAKVAVSGYDSDLYHTMLRGWRRVAWEMPNHSGQGKTKQRRIEAMWMNF